MRSTYGPQTDKAGGGPYDLTYLEDLIDRTFNSTMEAYIRRFNKELFFTKHLDWRDEWEYRWVLRTDIGQPMFVSILDCLHAVILGNDCKEKTNEEIHRICNSQSIPVFRAYLHGWALSVFEYSSDETATSLNGL